MKIANVTLLVLVAGLLLGGAAWAKAPMSPGGPDWDLLKSGPGPGDVGGFTGPKQGGDTVATATVIPGLPYNDTGTTCGYAHDYNEVCPFTTPGSPDVVYAYSPAANVNVDIDLWGSAYDTKLYVYENAVTPGAPLACNDDYYSDYTSFLENVPFTGGNTYYIVVDGYGSSSCGNYVLNVLEYVPCIVPCPPGAQIEGEPPLVDGYLDTWNGGCNNNLAAPPLQTVTKPNFCGVTGWYDAGSSRDTDWLVVEATGSQVVWTLDAEYYPTYGFELLNMPNCGAAAVGQTILAGPCAPATMTINTTPGQLVYLWVGPSDWESNYEYNYVINITGIVIDSVDFTNPAIDESCPFGGPGDQDGFLDPGETFQFSVDMQNIFGADLTGLVVSAAITQGSGTIEPVDVLVGDLADGAIVTLDFSGVVGLGNCCGDIFEIGLTVTANELMKPAGPFPFGYFVGDYTPPLPVPIFLEEFETWPLAGWTITDASNPGGWGWDSGLTNGCGKPNLTGGAGDYAAADSDCYGPGTVTDTAMVSPPFSLAGGYAGASLSFSYDFNSWAFALDEGRVDISTDGWATFDTLFSVGPAAVANGTEVVDLAPYVGEPGVELRFYYHGEWDYWFQVDDVLVEGLVPQPCYTAPCADPDFSSWILQTTDFQNFYKWETVCIDMTDPAYPSYVDFYVDGVYIGTDWTHPFCITFDASAWPIGPHELYAVVNTCEISWMTNVATFYTVGSVYAIPKADPPTGIAELTTQFTANAQWGAGAYTYLWWFGDGTPPSTEMNPEHTFMDPGDYLVTLQVWDGLGERYICAPYKVTVVELPLPFLEPDFVVANPRMVF